MRKFETFLIACILGMGPILFCLVVFFFIAKTAGFLTDTAGPRLALGALVTGLVIDVIFLGRWVRNAYRFNNNILAAIYIYYSVGALGMGMGVPLFNFGVGMLAGVYIARRIHYTHAEQEVCRVSIKKTAVFAANVMMAMCCLTGTLALFGGMIGYRFESPVVSFTFTIPILIGIVLSGGLLLSVLQYWLTHAAARVIMKLGKYGCA